MALRTILSILQKLNNLFTTDNGCIFEVIKVMYEYGRNMKHLEKIIAYDLLDVSDVSDF